MRKGAFLSIGIRSRSRARQPLRMCSAMRAQAGRHRRAGKPLLHDVAYYTVNQIPKQ